MVLIIVILGAKSSISWSDISFYSDVLVEHLNASFNNSPFKPNMKCLPNFE